MKDRLAFELRKDLKNAVKAKASSEGKSLTQVMSSLCNGYLGTVSFGNCVPCQSLESVPKETSAIYVVFNNDGIIYVGQSIQLKQRLQGHQHKNYFEEKDAFVLWVNVPRESMDAIEDTFIDILNPELNSRRVGIAGKAVPIYASEATFDFIRSQAEAQGSLKSQLLCDYMEIGFKALQEGLYANYIEEMGHQPWRVDGNGRTRANTFYIPEELRYKLMVYAIELDRSLSWVVRDMLLLGDWYKKNHPLEEI